MKTIESVRKHCIDYLSSKGVATPKLEADHLLSKALDVERMDLYLDFERPLSEKELSLCRDLLKRRGQREPLQYILKTVPFFHCEIEVSPSVLIPRPETEQLVEMIVKELEGQELKGKRLLDLCAGSGCIAIALKKALPDLEVFASDICEKALNLAKKNATQNGVEVGFVQSDLFENLQEKHFDFLVSNPPYVSEEEFLSLEPELKYEPKKALVSGETGLEIYQAIANSVEKVLKPGAKCWLEIGSNQAETLQTLFQEGETLQDWSSNKRFLSFSM